MDDSTFLALLPPEARAAVEHAGRVRRYPKGSAIFAIGDRGHDVLVLVDGAVKVFVTARNGREVVLEVLHGGEILGELAAVDGGFRSAAAVALEASQMLVIDRLDFLRLLDEEPGIGAALMRVLAFRLRGTSRRQLEFGSSDALARVCHRLLEVARRYGAPGPDGRMMVDVPFSQSNLADWAGLSREAVVKALHSMRTLGWIDSDAKHIVMLDQQAIEQRADI